MPRRSRPPEDESLTKFGYLVAVVILLEAAYLLWWAGALRPLG